jgi:hypothetical protein
MEARRLKMEAWRVFSPVFADSNHVDEEQASDTGCIEVKSWIGIQVRTTAKSLIRIRIRIEVMRIRNPDENRAKKRPVSMGMCA